MCRIAGIIDFNNSLGNELERVVVEMRDSMTHGGPDDAGLYISEDRKVALGHRRLSILDLSSAGHQPMSNENRTIWITYNGEIYNFQEIRNELTSLGCNFKSNTDTEVLIYGYEKWGIEGILSRLCGMFAFCVYDNRNKNDSKIFLARDRFGIKPLYYFRDNNKFVFSSEIKAFLKSNVIPQKLNKQAQILFLLLGSVPVPFTRIENLLQLPAANYIELSKNKFLIKNYWNIKDFFKNDGIENADDVIYKTRCLLEESVKLHLISDAPIGVFLSGGMDSSSVALLAARFRADPINTLSVSFSEKDYDESYYQNLLSKKFNTKCNDYLLQKSEFINEIPKIFSAMDQPSIDGINTYFIAKKTKECGLKSVLSGVGGDEVFLGYSHYRKANFANSISDILKIFPPVLRNIFLNSVSFIHPFEKITYLKNPNSFNSYRLFRGLFSSNEVRRILDVSESELDIDLLQNDSFNPLSPVEYFDYMDFNHYLQNQILKDSDFMSMYHSVEIRVPFLDHKLVEYVLGISSSLKLAGSVNKPLLYRALSDALPFEIANRKKMGFTFPFQKWLLEEKDLVKEMLFENTSFNKDFLEKIYNSFSLGNIHWSRVWGLIVKNRFFNT